MRSPCDRTSLRGVGTRSRHWVAWATLSVTVSGCGVLQPTPSDEPEFAFQPLVDVGLFGGFPDVPPDWSMAELGDDTSVLVVDRGAAQQVRRVENDGNRWGSLGGFDGELLPAGDDGPVLRRVDVGLDQGFEDGMILLVGRIPNGPINQLELSIDGKATMFQAQHRPLVVYAFSPGTEIGDSYTTMDAGTHRFDVLPIAEVTP